MLLVLELFLFILVVYRWKWQAISPLLIVITYALFSGIIAGATLDLDSLGVIGDAILTLITDIPTLAVLMTCAIIDPPKNAFGQQIIDKIKTKFEKTN